KSEFEERRTRLAKSCDDAGLDGALVVSRGGKASTHNGYCLYLANYFTHWCPGVNDFPPYWNCRGHPAIVLPVHGEATLIQTMVPELGGKDLRIHDDVRADYCINEVRHYSNVIRGITETIREKGLEQGRIGLIGSLILSMKHFQELQDAFPKVEWVPSDDLLIDQMLIKSDAEWGVIRYACESISEVTDQVLEAGRPGVSEAELVTQIDLALRERGCELSFMRPNRLNRLERGQIYYMAIVGHCNGYFFDMSRNKVVGAKPSPKQAELLDLLNDFVLRQTEECQPGRTGGEASQFGIRYLIDERKLFTREEFEKGITGTYACFGHGLGLSWTPPNIRPGDETVLRPGMFMAVELVYNMPGLGLADVIDHNN
ncbi:MAG: M24 family metallopeptidase, partial [Candidatus Binatia bacterium]